VVCAPLPRSAHWHRACTTGGMAACGARALTFVALVLAGCSGAGNADLFEGSGNQNDIAATDPAPSATTPTPPSEVPDAGPPVPVPPVRDAGVDAPPPPPACTPEAEPNNDINHATTFTASLCGKIDSNNDVDFGRFVVPAGAKNLTITHAEQNGKVSYRYYLDGQLLPVNGGDINAIPGAVYSVQIKLSPAGSGGDRPTYQLDVSFK
jgi:hypothetical protein